MKLQRVARSLRAIRTSLAGRYCELLAKPAGVPAAANLANLTRPIRELRADARPLNYRPDAGS